VVESVWRGAAELLVRRWKLALAVIIAITVLLGFGLTRIEFATGQDSYLNPDSQIALDNVEFQEMFGGEIVILLFSAEDGSDVADIISDDNLAELRRLHDELGAIDGVESLITPLTTLTFSDALVRGPGRDALLTAAGRDEAGADARNADIRIALARLGEVDVQEMGDPEWNDLLVYGNDNFEVVDGELVPPADADREIRLSLAGSFPNQRTAVGGIVLEGNASLDEQSEATEAILDTLETAEFEGFELTVTGSPVYLKQINDYLQGGMFTLGAVALVLMAIILAVLFGVRWRLLPLLAVVVGVLWTFSIIGLIGLDLSLVTISGLPILIGLGIDFAIQTHNRIVEEVDLDRERRPVGETLANLGPPLIA